MDREYLTNYQAFEGNNLDNLTKAICDGTFDPQKDHYPPRNRFNNLKSPVAFGNSLESGDIWTQIPFCGSLIVGISPCTPENFEKRFFKISEIPKVVEFIKETGKLQLVISDPPIAYEGLDYLDPIFKELRPPTCFMIPPMYLASGKEVSKYHELFYSLSKISLVRILKRTQHSSMVPYTIYRNSCRYVYLKIMEPKLAEEFENRIVDNPLEAIEMLSLWMDLLLNPRLSLIAETRNFPFEELNASQNSIRPSQNKEITFPFEIGRFLFHQLTNAAVSLHGCQVLMDEYNAYDLEKIQETLNEAILTNDSLAIGKSADDLSQTLDNIWNDKTIQHRIEGLRVGIPISLAVIGALASGIPGSVEGFLSGLGYGVLDKMIEHKTESISEKLSKFRVKSYQATIYDFKKTYKGRMTTQAFKSSTANSRTTKTA